MMKHPMNPKRCILIAIAGVIVIAVATILGCMYFVRFPEQNNISSQPKNTEYANLLAKEYDTRDEIIDGYLDTLYKIDEDEWKTATLQDKQDIIETIVLIEFAFQGLPNVPNVKLGYTGNGKDVFYQINPNTLMINPDRLIRADSEEIIYEVCYELRIAYQIKLGELYESLSSPNRRLYLMTSTPKEFYMYYIENNEGYKIYSDIDARSYADLAKNDYKRKVKYYLGKITRLE